MNRRIALAAAFAVAGLGFWASDALAAPCSLGQKAEAHWKNAWYPVTVTGVKGEMCYIHYDGYDSSWDEWIDASRYRVSFEVGDSVRILWRGKWYPGRVLETNSGRYYITYSGYDSSWNEWVEAARISR